MCIDYGGRARCRTRAQIEDIYDCSGYAECHPSIGLSFTPLLFREEVGKKAREFVRSVFATVGTTTDVQLESHIDYMTGFTGSGPAFVAALADAMWSHATSRD